MLRQMYKVLHIVPHIPGSSENTHVLQRQGDSDNVTKSPGSNLNICISKFAQVSMIYYSFLQYSLTANSCTRVECGI